MSLSWFFAFFFVSGFCSLVFQVVWLRLAMASFGVTSPLVAIVLSVFMAGLALGSWAGGRLARRLQGRPAAASLRLYAFSELGIAVAGVAVPRELEWGRHVLSGLGESMTWGSGGYYLASGLWIAITLLPFTTCMGATLPLGMAGIRRLATSDSARSFSFLYLANVTGAAVGTAVSAFVLIELLGFRNTSLLAASFNVLVFACAFALSRSPSARAAAAPGTGAPAPAAAPPAPSASPAAPLVGRGALWLLFLTGFMSIAMEVVWTRQFTPYLGTVVYAFAATLALYLVATTVGSRLYRAAARPGGWAERFVVSRLLWAWVGAGLLALLPLVMADPRLPLNVTFLKGVLRVGLGVMPFCAMAGILTPMLVDAWSGGDPDRAGRAYAVNVLGCIVGPLVAGFLLLPLMSERWALFALVVPCVTIGLMMAFPVRAAGAPAPAQRPMTALVPVAALSLVLVSMTRDFDSRFEDKEVRRDSTATVVATGTGEHRRLLVNGVGITELSPITKVMAHMPLAWLPAPPTDGLVICFGMGTSFRSMLTWDIATTAVELVPSVPPLMGYFHDDAQDVLAAPNGHVVVDDGRRFLERSHAPFDVITIDAPPPVEAAGSSLLYSREFYVLIKKRLKPDGILQQWWPGGEDAILCSVARALADEFPHVRAFRSLGGVGFHFYASRVPLPEITGAALAARLPPRATQDLIEWNPDHTPAQMFDEVLHQEIPMSKLVDLVPGIPALDDNHPVNEYYVLRRRGLYTTPDFGAPHPPSPPATPPGH